MNDSQLENNIANIAGEIITPVKKSHEMYGETFYGFRMKVPRLSERYDHIVVTISERLFDEEVLKIGRAVLIDGQFRSYNNLDTNEKKLFLTVFAREIERIGSVNDVENPNRIYLNGFLCKKPIYRKTPFGREITDLLLAINRAFKKSDYIPCVTWGKNARYAKDLSIGDNIRIWGRVQSRSYQKKFENGHVEDKIAYEVSVSKMQVTNVNNVETEKNGV